ncbi:MAG: NCS2 family permease [Christensenellales bacterium]|jgi:AGZA family xanthine/uracil permease-like MFS transporter
MFKLKENGTNVRTEIIAGITTFFTMAYIIFVNPSILSQVITRADGTPLWDAVFVATIIAAVVGTLIMGLVANVPYAQAPGMGLNAFFTFTVCFSLGFTWQQALAMVFICGIINILITVTQIRKAIIKAIPRSLQSAIGSGIGMFIAYIGLKDANIINFSVDGANVISGALVAEGGVTTGNVLTNGAAVPVLSNFMDKVPLLAIIGLVIIVILMMLKVKGAILIGIIATALIGIPMGVTTLSPAEHHSIAAVSETFWKFDFAGLLAKPDKILVVITTIFAFSLTDTFDTIGTFIGTGRKSGIFDDKDEAALFEGRGFKSKMDKALFADATATSIGAMFGTSNTTTYVESAAGISVGGRTGLTSVVTAIMFALCLLFLPVASAVPSAATAPALIIVGVLMMEPVGTINWSDLEEAIPAFMAMAVMPLAYSISTGIAAGFIFYVVVKIFKGKAKEVHPILYVSTALFLLNFVISAIPAV